MKNAFTYILVVLGLACLCILAVPVTAATEACNEAPESRECENAVETACGNNPDTQECGNVAQIVCSLSPNSEA